MRRLPKSFYRSNDVVSVAKSLIGQHLVTLVDGHRTVGKITETEAYHQDEQACHAYNGRYTKRTSLLFEAGGLAYIYLCYGIHHLFNVTTGPAGVGSAVLIRAVEPVEGVEVMMQRRGIDQLHPRITSGPGTLSQALGLTIAYNGSSLLNSETIGIEESKKVPDNEIVASVRVGIDYAGADASLPWRFYLKSSQWVSRK